MSKRHRVSRIGALLWAGREMERQMADPVNLPEGGYCDTCHAWRFRHVCAEPHAHDPGACCVCGERLDTEPPF